MEHLKVPFVRFILHEAIVERTLLNTLDSCMNYWVMVLKNDEQREELIRFAEGLVEVENNPGTVV